MTKTSKINARLIEMMLTATLRANVSRDSETRNKNLAALHRAADRYIEMAAKAA